MPEVPNTPITASSTQIPFGSTGSVSNHWNEPPYTYYPYTNYSYITDNTERAFRVARMLRDKNLVNCNGIDNFISLVEELKKVI